jgi:hypothetical protein
MKIGVRLGTLAMVLVVLGASGCGSDSPKVFRTRPPLPSCGSLPPRRPGDPIPPDEERAVACLTDAHRARKGAELTYVWLDTEGGPTRFWLRTLPSSDGVELFSHTADSDFGKEAWALVKCASLTLDPTGLPVGKDCAAAAAI